MSGGPSAVVPSLVSVIRDKLYKQGTTKKKKKEKLALGVGESVRQF